MKCLKFYKDPAKKLAYYKKWHDSYYKDTYPAHKWKIHEVKLVLNHTITDTELSKLLQVSVRSIQCTRRRYKKLWA